MILGKIKNQNRWCYEDRPDKEKTAKVPYNPNINKYIRENLKIPVNTEINK